MAKVLQTTLKTRCPVEEFETTLEGDDGEAVSVIMSAACMDGSGEGATGAVALIYDLTQVKRLEQNVLRADRLSSIGTLAAGMALGDEIEHVEGRGRLAQLAEHLVPGGRLFMEGSCPRSSTPVGGWRCGHSLK